MCFTSRGATRHPGSPPPTRGIVRVMAKIADDTADRTAEPDDAGLGTPPATVDLGLPQAGDPPLTAHELERQKVEDANGEIKPGQTVIHDTAGNPSITGSEKVTRGGDADLSISNHGDAVTVATPLGIVTLAFEVDDKKVGIVTVSTQVEVPSHQLTGDVLLLKG